MAASHDDAMMRSFVASRSYAYVWKYEMPPISAAPAMKWSQSIEQLGHQLDVAGVALDER